MTDNLKAIGSAAQLSPSEQKKLDDFSKALAVHRELNGLPQDAATKKYNQLTAAQQADLQKNFGNEDPAVLQHRSPFGTAWHYTGGAVANAIGYGAGHLLAGLNNVSDFMTRAYRTGAIMVDQGKDLGSAWDIANDKGDKVFSPGRIEDAKSKWGNDAVSVAMRMASGEDPTKIMATATPEQIKYLQLASPNAVIPGMTPEETKAARANFQDTQDAVNAAKYSPGRFVANLVLPGQLEGSGFFYKAISGAVDAAYRVLADPLLIAGKVKRGIDVGKYALDVVVGNNKVAEVFAQPQVQTFWNQYGAVLNDFNKAHKAGNTEAKAVLRRQLATIAPEFGPEVVKAFIKADVPVQDAKTAQAFFENTKQLDVMMRGQIGRQRVLIPRMDPIRQARVKFATTANKVFDIDKIGPRLIDDMFFGGAATTDGIAKTLIDGQEAIVDLVKATTKNKDVARFSTEYIQNKIDKFKAAFTIAPLFKDNMMDVTAQDAAEQMYRLARLVLPQRESRLISEAFDSVEEVGKKKDMFYGLWSTIAEIRGLNATEPGQLIVRRLTGKGNTLFSVSRADDAFAEVGALPSDFNSLVSAPSLIDLDRASARSGLIGRMLGQANKDWVNKMTGAWSFLTLAGPRYALRNAGEDLMVNLAIGESPWGIAKARLLSTRLNTAIGQANGLSKTEAFVQNPLGLAMRFINKDEAGTYAAEIKALDANILATRNEIKSLKAELKTASDIDKPIIQSKINEKAASIKGGTVGQTREIFARALTEGRLNRLYQQIGRESLTREEAEILAEQIRYGDIENALSVISEGGFNFATGNDYVSRATSLFKTTGVRQQHLIVDVPQGKYARAAGERGFRRIPMAAQDEPSMVAWLMRINYFANDKLGAIAVANLADNAAGDAAAIKKIFNWITDAKNPEAVKFLADARLANNIDAMDLARLTYNRAKEIFVKRDGKTLNKEILNKIRQVDEETGQMVVRGRIGLDDMPKSTDDIPEYVVGPSLVPVVDQSQYTQTLMNNGWTWLGMANARMSREPLVINEMVKIRKQMRESGFEKKYLESFLEGVDTTSASKVAAAELKAKRAYASMVEDRAINQSLAYIDNPLVRTQIAFASRNFARFYRATEDFYRRMYKAVKYNPESIVKAALTYEGVTHSGFIQKDDQGEAYFVYPGVAQVYNAVQNTLSAMGIGNEFKVPFPVELGAKLKMITPSLNPDSLVPTFAGPIAGASITTISSLVNIFDPGAADTIKGYALGKYAVDQPVLSALLPAHINRLLGAMNTDDRNSQYASAWRKAVTYLEASGHGLPKKYDAEGNLIPPTPAELEAYRIAVKNTTLGILRVRFAAGFFAPASPSISLKSDMAQWISDNGVQSWKQAFNNLLDKYPGDYDAAMAKWVELYPNEVPYTVTESERKSIAPLRYAAEAGYFVDQNKGLFKDYPSAAAFLIPHKSGFSWDAYKSMKDMGMITNKRVEDYLREVQTASDLQQYYQKKNEYESQLQAAGGDFDRSILRQEFDAWKTKFFAGRPLVAEELSQGSQKAIDRLRTLDELNMMLSQNLNIRPKTEAKLREMSKIYSDYKTEREQYDLIGGSSNLAQMVKEDTIIRLRELAKYNENTQAVYDVLFGRLLGD